MRFLNNSLHVISASDLHNKSDEHIDQMRGYRSAKTADCVGCNRLRGQLSVAERVEHGGVSGEIPAPAHTYRGADRYRIAVHPSLTEEVGHKTQSGTHRTERCNRESYKM